MKRNVTKYPEGNLQDKNPYIVPPLANLLAAANHVRTLFESKKFSYAICGGLGTLCLGYRCDVLDIHIVYEDKDYFRIKKKLEADRRVTLPVGMNPLFPFKMLVCTGPTYQDAGCSGAATIGVNMIPPGSCGSPLSGTLSGNVILLSTTEDGRLQTFKGLNMLYMVQTMVHLCAARDLAWDPRNKVLYLCRNFGNEVEAIRTNLDGIAVQRHFLGTVFFSSLSREDQCICYRVLLGKEPPPVMSITPPTPHPGHGCTFSECAIQKTRLNPRLSKPGLRKQSISSLLSPTWLYVSKAARKYTITTTREPAEHLGSTNISLEPIAPNMNSLQTAKDPKPVARQTLAHYMPSTGPRVPQAMVTRQGIELKRADEIQTPHFKCQQDTSHCSCSQENTNGCSQYSAKLERTSREDQLVDSSEMFGTSQTPQVPSRNTKELVAVSLSPSGDTSEPEASSCEDKAAAEISQNLDSSLRLRHHHTKPQSRMLLQDLLVDTKKQQQLNRPTVARIRSAPPSRIPQSLVAGQGSTPLSRRINTSGNEFDELMFPWTDKIEVNATKYLRYHSQLSSASSGKSFLQFVPTPLESYEAHKPDILPSSLAPPRFDSIIEQKLVVNPYAQDNIDTSESCLATQNCAQNDEAQLPHISQDAARFAQTYRAEMPDFEDGYGIQLTKHDDHTLNHCLNYTKHQCQKP